MIVTWRVALRIALLVLLFVLLQSSFFSLVTLLHVSPWVLPACAVIFGLLGGSMVGATVGFAIGFFADGLADGPLGTACLIFMGAGYAAGLFRERGATPSRIEVAAVCGAATVLANVAMGLFTVLLGFDAAHSPALIVDVMLQGVYGFLLTFPIYALIRRVLRPALIDEFDSRLRPRTRRAMDFDESAEVIEFR
ncbi:MAG: rod shape-determining protein MreD [Actinomycetota bacterium]|nr:rod shape-determining protein MreD [Actinomycetota bacterium]